MLQNGSEAALLIALYKLKGKDFVNGALDMISGGDKVNHEYYVCPVYNHLIKDKKKIGIFGIQENQMHGTGTPEDLKIYEELI